MASPDWFNTNANRAYPFLDRTVARPGAGEVKNIPHSAVVDAGFVLGTGAGFDPASHVVRLAKVRRSGDDLFFDFETTAPAMFGSVLTFRRTVTDGRYLTEDADSDAEYGLSLTNPDEACLEPLWSGFLATGDLTALLALLPGDGELTGGTGQAGVEPALVQNLSGAYVSSVSLANDDRTRVESPAGCDATSWPVPPEPVYLNAACLRGAVQFKPGYNAVVTQADADNTLTFGAEVGAGAGQPCNEVPLYGGEAPPAGGSLLSGGPACGQVLRSVNGVGGRLFDVVAGLGFQVTPLPDSNRVVVDCNFAGLALCPEDVSSVSESV